MKNDLLVPVPLSAVAVCVSVFIACLLVGDATGAYPTPTGSMIMHWIYDYDPSMSHDLARYHDEEGDALFVVLTAPMFVALVASMAFRAIAARISNVFRPRLAPAE